jgi:collagenase-like PrtC family protease
MSEQQPKLALGPVLYYWPKEKLLDFYERMSATPVDIVYLGETVCSKRHAMNTADWLDLAERMRAAGKEVVLATMALLEAESELKTLRRLCENGRFTVEANDMGAVRLLSERKTPFVLGTGINVYSDRTLQFLAGLGAKRWVMPSNCRGRRWRRFRQDGRRAWKPRSSFMAGCRWRIPPAVLPPAITICPRMIASIAVWITRKA